MDILFAAFNLMPGQAIYWPTLMNILLKRILEAGFVSIRDDPRLGTVMVGVKLSPDLLTITLAGRVFIEGLGLNEL
jgi:hypothetical protein